MNSLVGGDENFFFGFLEDSELTVMRFSPRLFNIFELRFLR